MTMMLVCGGRYYGRTPIGVPPEQMRDYARKASMERFILFEALDHLRRDRDVKKVLARGQTGADTHAIDWARSRCVAFVIVRAEWKRYGRAAGPILNTKMLEFKPDFVVAFTGGRGTADMIRQAHTAGVEVIDYRQDEAIKLASGS